MRMRYEIPQADRSDLPLNLQMVFDMGYKDLMDGRYDLRFPDDPFYYMGFIKAGQDLAGEFRSR